MLLILNLSCTAKKFISENTTGSEKEYAERIINNVRRNNISEENFYIEKGEFSVIMNNKRTRYIFSAKYNKPDTYLISIRSSTGIEGVRVYLTKDTVLINDRIGKRLLYGKPKDLEKIAGLPYFVIKAVFGDLLINGDTKKDEKKRVENQVILIQQFQGKIWKSVIDPKIGKVVSTVFSNGIQKEAIIFNYSKFGRSGKYIPAVIDIKDLTNKVNVKLKLERIQILWKGEIRFIPGKGYTKEEIR